MTKRYAHLRHGQRVKSNGDVTNAGCAGCEIRMAGSEILRIPCLGSRILHPAMFTRQSTMLSYGSPISSPRVRGSVMTQNPPFPSPDELKAKLSEFMTTH